MVNDQTLALAATTLQTSPEDIIKAQRKGQQFNNHDQGEQYNLCTIEVPRSVLGSLESTIKYLEGTLKTSEETLKVTQDVLKITQEALAIAYKRIAELEKA